MIDILFGVVGGVATSLVPYFPGRIGEKECIH